MEDQVQTTTLISQEYQSELFKKHVSDPGYGGECLKYVDKISSIINGLEIDEVLDYGCGKGELAKNLRLNHRIKLFQYDPAIPDISETPDPAQMVVCSHVMEHVEDAYVHQVMDDIKRCTKDILFIAIEGDSRRWLPEIMKRFQLYTFLSMGKSFFAIAYADAH